MSLRTAVRATLDRVPFAGSAARGALGAARRLRWDMEDALDALAGRKRPLTPPRRLWGLVAARDYDFDEFGRRFTTYLEQSGLKPEDRVLEVGCGIGRVAAGLTRYLSPAGSYDGFDIMPAAIRWCQREITPRFANFRFQLAQVSNPRYRREGASAAAFKFPYPDASFDFVILASVFTHMLPADVENYLAEIARVMAADARCLISYYLLNPERRAIIAKGGGAFSFAHTGDGYWCEYAENPEAALAYEESAVRALYARNALEVIAFDPGVWFAERVQHQDVLIAQKRAAHA